MKTINYYKIKKLLIKEKQLNINNLAEKLKHENLLNFSCYSVGTSTTNSIKEIYKVRLERYLNGEITNTHDGLKEFVENIHNSNEKEIKIHSFDANISDTSYTIFTDTKVKNIIGIIESSKS